MSPEIIRVERQAIETKLKEIDGQRKIVVDQLSALRKLCPHQNVDHTDGFREMPPENFCKDCGLNFDTKIG